MDGIKITKVVEELMCLLQKMGMEMGISELESVTEEDIININAMRESFKFNFDFNVGVDLDVQMDELKEELGSWFIPDYELFVGA